MPSDFTVIQAVRQRFGDSDPEFESPQEQEAPFVGRSKDFPFACPGVDSSQMAVLQFESFAVSAGRILVFAPGLPRNILRINGVDIPGGITPGARESGQNFWKSHMLLVPANVLRAQNVLHIEAVRVPTTPNQNNFDNFIIDNVAVFFKLRGSPVAGVAGRSARKRTAGSKKAKKSPATKSPAKRSLAKKSPAKKSPAKKKARPRGR